MSLLTQSPPLAGHPRQHRKLNIPVEGQELGQRRSIASRRARSARWIAEIGPEAVRLKALGFKHREIAEVFNGKGMLTPTGYSYLPGQIEYLLRKSG